MGYDEIIGGERHGDPGKYDQYAGLRRKKGFYISAYGVAVKNGFHGTEEEWLESLHGEKGDKGDGIHIVGVYDTYEELIEDRPIGEEGESVLVGLDLYNWDTENEEWKNAGSIKGPKGDKGDKGDKGEDTKYVYHQSSAASSWGITHNLDKFPSVTVVDSANTVVVGDVRYIDRNSLIINFSAPFSGAAYLN